MNDGTEVHGFVDQGKKIQRISFLVVGKDFFLLSVDFFKNFFLTDFFGWPFWFGVFGILTVFKWSQFL